MKRHDLVLLDYEYCKSNKFLEFDQEDIETILDWIYNQYPFIISKQGSIDNKKLNVGFMLPLEEGKKKINLTVKSDAVSEYLNPIKLFEILPKINQKWNLPLRELLNSFLTLDLHLYVFGSSMWQYFLEKEYMTYKSDIDLLWKPTSVKQLNTGLIILKECMEKYNLNIDGEIEFPCQSACSWKELLTDDKKIIVKRLYKVSLESKIDLINTLKGV